MWTLIWTVLIIASIVVPIVLIVSGIKKAIGVFREVESSAQAISYTFDNAEKPPLRPLRPSAVFADAKGVEDARTVRAYIAQSRTYRRHRRFAMTLSRWNRLHLTSNTVDDFPYFDTAQPAAPEGMGLVRRSE